MFFHRNDRWWWYLVKVIALDLCLLLSLPTPDVLADTLSPNRQTQQSGELGPIIRMMKALRHQRDQQETIAELLQPRLRAALAEGIDPETLSNLCAITIPLHGGEVIEAWTPEESVVSRRSRVVENQSQVADLGSYDLRPTTYDRSLTTNDERRPLVIHIQDLHTQPQAQAIAARIMEHLAGTYGIDRVAHEAAWQPFDLDFVLQFPKDETLRALVARTLLELGELSGAEYAAMAFRLPLHVQGVDDRILYTESVDRFTSVMRDASSMTTTLNRYDARLRRLATKLYAANDELQQFDRRWMAFHRGDEALPDYASFLARAATTHGIDVEATSPALVKLLKSLHLGKQLDRDTAKREFAAWLTGALIAAESPAHRSIRPILEVVHECLRRNAAIPSSLYRGALEMADRIGAPLDAYPALQSLRLYFRLAQDANPHDIYRELHEMEELAIEQLARSDDERQLALWNRRLTLLRDFVGLKLTAQQYLTYETKPSAFDLARCDNFLTALEQRLKLQVPEAERGGVISDEQRQAVEQFYRLAHARDQVMATRTMEWMTGQNDQPVESQVAGRRSYDVRRTTYDSTRPAAVVLVAGGFHTEGITEYLRARGLPYLVITPTATEPVDEERYHRRIAGELAGDEELLVTLRRVAPQIKLAPLIKAANGMLNATVAKLTGLISVLARNRKLSEQYGLPPHLDAAPEVLVEEARAALPIGLTLSMEQDPVAALQAAANTPIEELPDAPNLPNLFDQINGKGTVIASSATTPVLSVLPAAGAAAAHAANGGVARRIRNAQRQLTKTATFAKSLPRRLAATAKTVAGRTSQVAENLSQVAGRTRSASNCSPACVPPRGKRGASQQLIPSAQSRSPPPSRLASSPFPSSPTNSPTGGCCRAIRTRWLP